MQFDDFDKKIIDAAEHHHPAYDEKAWEKMETLLNKHLPVPKDDRRRIIFFLLLFLLLGTGAFLLVHTLNQNKTSLTKEQTNDVGKSQSTPLTTDSGFTKSREGIVDRKIPGQTEKNNELKSKGAATSGDDDTNTSGVTGTEQQPHGINGVKENLPVKETPGKVLRPNKKGNKIPGQHPGIIAKVALPKQDPEFIEQQKISAENKQTETKLPSVPAPVNDSKPGKDSKNGIAPAVSDTAVERKPGQQDIQQGEKNISTSQKKAGKKPGKQKQSPFAITFTAGPDLSFIGVSELGKVKMKYGAGLSYTWKRLTLRSGFYIARKIYSAGGAYYHPYYADLEKVDGDCRVFEIPVTVSYNFIQAKNHNWFVSTGLSSYLMKKETYGYLSKDPATGTTDYTFRSWSNKNKHYFSVLNLSAGYERKFNNRISLIAEPYLQLPFTGIGNGKMKLNSAGLSLTLSVRPFAGKRK